MFENTNIYMTYKPKKVSFFVTQFIGIRLLLVVGGNENVKSFIAICMG